MGKQWDHQMWLKGLEGSELIAFKAKDAWAKTEEEKFALPPKRYTSGEGIKKELQMELRSKEGVDRMNGLTSVWKVGLKEDQCRSALAEAWEKYTVEKKRYMGKERVERVSKAVREGAKDREETNVPKIEMSDYEDDEDWEGMPPLGK